LASPNLLLKHLAADDPQRQKAEQIARAGEGAAELTQQLLAVSRRQVLAPQILDLNDRPWGSWLPPSSRHSRSARRHGEEGQAMLRKAGALSALVGIALLALESWSSAYALTGPGVIRVTASEARRVRIDLGRRGVGCINPIPL
jgi:hypothetical protein